MKPFSISTMLYFFGDKCTLYKDLLYIVHMLFHFRSPYPLTDFRCKSLHLTWAKSLQSGEAEASRNPRYVFISEAYHNFIENPKLSPSIRKPDLVLALNCGFIFYKDWDPTLPFLTKYVDVPLVFTEYYEEDCKHDLGKLGKKYILMIPCTTLQ